MYPHLYRKEGKGILYFRKLNPSVHAEPSVDNSLLDERKGKQTHTDRHSPALWFLVWMCPHLQGRPVLGASKLETES